MQEMYENGVVLPSVLTSTVWSIARPVGGRSRNTVASAESSELKHLRSVWIHCMVGYKLGVAMRCFGANGPLAILEGFSGVQNPSPPDV